MASAVLGFLLLTHCSGKDQADKYDMGMNKPPWGEAMDYIVTSVSLSATKTEPQKATALAALAVDICEKCEPMRPYAQLTLAFAQIRRDDPGGFFRQTSKACESMPPDMAHTTIVLEAANVLVDRKLKKPAKNLLEAWLKRLDSSDAADAKEATQRLLKTFAAKSKKAKKKPETTPPPKDFPIVLDE